MKNAFDHLFHEWKAMPLGLITAGGHGGSKVSEHLRSMCGGGLKMRVAMGGVQVNLPKSAIGGGQWVKEDDEWLAEYDGKVKDLVEEVVGMVGEVKRVGEGSQEKAMEGKAGA